MNILFLTMVKIEIERRDIYNDLMRFFRDNGHNVYIVTPVERREGKTTNLEVVEGFESLSGFPQKGTVYTLNVRTLNLQKTNLLEKGIGQLSIEYLYKRAIEKHFAGVQFDLIMFSTPPITFPNVIRFVKKQNPMALSYLLLKDIFPQNAVDLGILSKTGFKGLLYKHFRKKEKALYQLSDVIGCMSPANVRFVLEHNPEISPNKVEVNPNSLQLISDSICEEEKLKVLKMHNLPTDKPIFIYGGNLGRPQGIPFLIKCLDANKCRQDCHFVVIGTGTYYEELAEWYKQNQDCSVTVMKGLPKEDYDRLVQSCHVGLIFLDYLFTIPNFPSRLLSYLEYKMPVVCATDVNCDMGEIAISNGFGVWAPSNNVEAFTKCVDDILNKDIAQMGANGYEFLKKNYLVEHSYNQIMKHF